MTMLREIYQYREMVFSLIKRDLRGRYKGSALGFLWTFLNPLFQLLVYSFVFGTVMGAAYPKYYLYLFVALIPWLFFSTSLVGGAGCIYAQKDMVNKIYFPREVLPLVHVTCQLINMLLSFVVLFAVIVVTRHGVNFLALCYLPIIMLVEYMLALGFTLIVSAVTVFLRDVQYVLNIVVMAWQFLSPVMYGLDRIPQRLQGIFLWNPMAPVLLAYRDILYEKKIPDLSTLTMACVMGIVLLAVGLVVFEKLKKHFSEEL